jgi:TolA-binding protein
MKIKYIIRFLSIYLGASLLLCAEPNYGTSGQTQSLNSMSSMRQKIMQQEERIDGLTTIIEGLSASLYELQSKNIQHPSTEKLTENSDALLKKLAKMIDDINADYVSKSDLEKALGKKKTTSPEITEKKKDKVSSKSNAVTYSEGVRHFVKHHYDEAKKRFTITDEKSYKPAASNYYLGEIAYYTKKYEDAIFYFKKSAGLYDKASYIDTLLLHTAISLDKTGEKSQARTFYENIIENYKGKKTAKIAEQRLKKL